MSTDLSMRASPHDLESERALLGELLLAPELLSEASGVLRGEHFYSAAHAAIWRWMLSEAHKGRAFDMLTLCAWADAGGRDRVDELGGLSYLSGLPESVPFGVVHRVGERARHLVALARRRKLLLLSARLQEAALGDEEAVELGRRLEEMRALVGEGALDAARLEAVAPHAGEVYAVEDFVADVERPLVSLATLPPWEDRHRPGEPDRTSKAGHGWGTMLDRLLGGGLRPPYLMTVGASSAGGGKTAFVHQVLDGLAMRSLELFDAGAGLEPLTPVLMVSEMGVQALTWRSLARYTGESAAIYRAGRSASALLDLSKADVDSVLRRGAQVMRDSKLAKAHRAMMRVWDPSRDRGFERGPAMIARLGEICQVWTESLERESGRAVWPVLFIDPIQRWMGEGDEVQGLNDLSSAIHRVAYQHDLVVIVTSDTNKSSASASSADKERGSTAWAAGVMRGSYNLMHLADGALVIYTPLVDDAPEEGAPKRRPRKKKIPRDAAGNPQVKVVVAKNRWGPTTDAPADQPTWFWEPHTLGRFRPAEPGDDDRPVAGRLRGRGPPPTTKPDEAKPKPPEPDWY